jgi:hypothetical protein
MSVRVLAGIILACATSAYASPCVQYYNSSLTGTSTGISVTALKVLSCPSCFYGSGGTQQECTNGTYISVSLQASVYRFAKELYDVGFFFSLGNPNTGAYLAPSPAELLVHDHYSFCTHRQL